MSEGGGNSYTVLQTVEALNVSPKRVYELIDEGTLEFRLDEQTGCWRIDARSVRAHLNHLKSFSLGPEGTNFIATATSVPGIDQGKERSFDSDLLVLLIIGGITLLAAGYTLLPALLEG